MTTREQVAAKARSLLGTPFAHQGKTPGVALDCIGSVAVVALEFEDLAPAARAWLADPEFRGYTPQPNVRKLLKATHKYMDPISKAAAGLADVLLFKFFDEPMHFGIISAVKPRRLVVHAYSMVGRVVENGIDDTWRARIVEAYRFKGLA